MGSLIFPARLDRSHCFQTHENPAPSTPTAYPTPTQIILPFGAVSGPFPFPKPTLQAPPISLYIRCAAPLPIPLYFVFCPTTPPISPYPLAKTQLLHVTALVSSSSSSSSSAMAKIKIGINGTSMPPNQPSPPVPHNNFNFTKLLLVVCLRFGRISVAHINFNFTTSVLRVWKDRAFGGQSGAPE